MIVVVIVVIRFQGLAERPSPEVASELRSRYKAIASTKRRAAEVLKSSNVELAAEVSKTHCTCY